MINIFSKHQLDAARADFHNSFPPTRRSNSCERNEFPCGVCVYCIYVYNMNIYLSIYLSIYL